MVERLARLLRLVTLPGSNLDPNSLSEESRVQMQLHEMSYVTDNSQVKNNVRNCAELATDLPH